ncbi:hypothetical protein B0T26DRAFT_207448 [Lasiosphaeria miniovina]|uniref:Uncharacterized protein n=1 Tax=Lasiosphaeria miniovina TaxID=1954250 RepID=A0AA40AUI8_9PEZI|nr:uncharacterized protein B0T26DRAFT_207448 [Lasiosphaeria miniovina]KAK0722201.1 hypothetical protein B0T26DRAFT_207448 [Lasiosphaeria miniovina]
METEQQELRRSCEDLRLTLSDKKKRVLLDQTSNNAPDVGRARPATETESRPYSSLYSEQSQGPLRITPASNRDAVPNYFLTAPNFPAAPSFPRVQSGPKALIGWDKPAPTQQISSPPLNAVSPRNVGVSAFSSGPGSNIGTRIPISSSARFSGTTANANMGEARAVHIPGDMGGSRIPSGRGGYAYLPERAF